MSYHKCYFCENESRFICVKCKKDICKDHAVFEKDPQNSDIGNWVCSDCHETTIKSNAIFGVIAVIVFIIIVVVGIVLFKRFSG